jgi:choline dehydrogenase-like flavoprotein
VADNEFDILVLGGGSAGYAAALRAVQLGFTVGLVEKNKLGGTCLHWGCIPTKAYLHSAEVAEDARESSKYGVHTTLESIDMAAVRDYKDKIVAGKFKGLTGLMKMRKITVIEGVGKLRRPQAALAPDFRNDLVNGQQGHGGVRLRRRRRMMLIRGGRSDGGEVEEELLQLDEPGLVDVESWAQHLVLYVRQNRLAQQLELEAAGGA